MDALRNMGKRSVNFNLSIPPFRDMPFDIVTILNLDSMAKLCPFSWKSWLISLYDRLSEFQQ